MSEFFAFPHRLFTDAEGVLHAADIIAPCEIYRPATPQERDRGITHAKVAEGLLILGLVKMKRYGVWYDKTSRLFLATDVIVPDLLNAR